MQQLRLDKIISDSARVTRSEAKALIKAGSVSVDGTVVKSPELKLDPENCRIICAGRQLCTVRFRSFMMNKPAGVLSATEDREQQTVIDLLPEELSGLGLFPVGRLDKDTTGLLILTNDGELSHRVTSPRHAIKKRYELTVEGELETEDILALAEGIELRDGTKCRPAQLEPDERAPSHGFITISEGKYHQVKRMLAALGKPVKELKRCSEGGLKLDENLLPGQVRELSKDEIALLFTD